MTIANPKIAASHYKSILAIDLVQEPKNTGGYKMKIKYMT